MRLQSPCPKCGSPMTFEKGFDGSYEEPPEPPMFYCSNSECVYEPNIHEVDWDNFDKFVLTAKQKNKIDKLAEALWKAREQAYEDLSNDLVERPLKIEDLFDGTPDKFDCDSDPDDVGNAYNCNDSDCEVGWHRDCEYHSMGRDENGKRWYIVYHDTIAGCCDYQPLCGFDEREGDKITPEVLAELQRHFESRMIDHFYGWAEYDLFCAMHGEDPLDNWYRPFTADDAIKSAKKNLEYLMKRRKI